LKENNCNTLQYPDNCPVSIVQLITNMTYLRKHLILLLFSFPLLVNAQEKQSINKIGINYSVDYCYRKLAISDPLYQQGIVWLNELENPTIGLNTGATFQHSFKNGLLVEGGLQYVRFGEKSDSISITTVDADVAGFGVYRNKYDYIGIPIKIGYQFPLGNRIHLSVSTGISTNFFMARQYSFHYKYFDGSSGVHRETTQVGMFGTQYNQVNLVSISSIGIEIQLFKAFSVRFEPTFRYSMNPIIGDQIQVRPYSAGINTTVFYRFGMNKTN